MIQSPLLWQLGLPCQEFVRHQQVGRTNRRFSTIWSRPILTRGSIHSQKSGRDWTRALGYAKEKPLEEVCMRYEEVGGALMIFLRVRTGVTQHFHIRLSEWLMLFPAFGMWLAFTAQPEMFDISSSYSSLAFWAEENTWASVFLIYAVIRAAALVVNGTFDMFPYSPHIRAFAATFGAFFWSQFSLGFLKAYLDGTGAASPVVAYTTLTIFELANVYRASRDVGFTYHEIKKRQQNEHNGVGV